MMSKHDIQQASSCFKLKGGLVALTTIELLHFTPDAFQQQLKKTIQNAPRFFEQSPVILALEKLEPAHQFIDFHTLKALCKNYGIILVAIRGGSASHRAVAQSAGLAWLPATRDKETSEDKDLTPQARKKSGKVILMSQHQLGLELSNNTPTNTDDSQEEQITPNYPESTIITTPVRSGQQIHSEGDLIVFGLVSTGAELLAAGNIHVYGPLRGRALAGLQGNKNARIFCQSFEAELVSIAGNYKLIAEQDQKYWKKPLQTYLTKDRLHLEALS